MNKISLFTILTILFSGCGGNTGSTNDPRDENVTMEINKTYTVYTGNKLIKDSDTAKIIISHTDGKSSSTVTLVSGSASIIRKP